MLLWGNVLWVVYLLTRDTYLQDVDSSIGKVKERGCLNDTHIEILWCLRLKLLPTIPVHLFQFPQLWTNLKRFEIYDIFHFNDSHKLWLPTKYISFVFIKKNCLYLIKVSFGSLHATALGNVHSSSLPITFLWKKVFFFNSQHLKVDVSYLKC